MAPPGVTAPALPAAAARLGAVLALALVAQVSLAPRLATTGATPDLLLLAVAAVAATRGRETGAAFGFFAGLAADAFLATPAGLSPLAFTLVGHAVGRTAGAGPRRPAAAALLGGAAGLAGSALVAAGAVLLGEMPPPAPPVLLRLLGGSAPAALLAPPAFVAMRHLVGRPLEAARP